MVPPIRGNTTPVSTTPVPTTPVPLVTVPMTPVSIAPNETFTLATLGILMPSPVVQGSVVVVTAVASLMSPSSPFLGGKISASARLASCGDGSVIELDRVTNPTNLRIAIGTHEADEYFGALVGDLIVLVTAWFLMSVVSHLRPSWRPKLISCAIRVHMYLNSGILTTSTFAIVYLEYYSVVGVAAIMGYIVSTFLILRKVYHPHNFHAVLYPVEPQGFDLDRPILACMRILTRKEHKWETYGGTEFAEKYGVVFNSFREGRQWYPCVDLAIVTILSVIMGLVSLPCGHLSLAAVILQALDLILLVALRPHHTFRDLVLDIIVYVAKLFMVILYVLTPQHPLRVVCVAAGHVVGFFGVYNVLVFFVKMYVAKVNKTEGWYVETRANYIRPEADDVVPVQLHAYVAMPPPVEMVPI